MELEGQVVWITTRRLKPGTTREEFSRAWRPGAFPEGMLRAYECWTDDGNEVVGILGIGGGPRALPALGCRVGATTRDGAIRRRGDLGRLLGPGTQDPAALSRSVIGYPEPDTGRGAAWLAR